MGWISNPGSSVVTSGSNTWTGPQAFTGSGNALDVSAVTGGSTASGTGVGDKLALYSSGTGGYGFGLAGGTLVAYIPSGTVFGVRQAVAGTASQGSTVASISDTGVITPLGGIAAPTAVSVNNYVAGQVPTATTSGTDTTPVSGTIFFGQVFVPANTTLTGISYLIGTVGGTNNVIVALYNNAGTLVKNSALAGTLVGTLATMQRVPFTSTYAAVGPAMYWVSVSMNGTTARLRTHTFGDHAAGSATGVFGTLGNISPVTTFTANTAPYAMTY